MPSPALRVGQTADGLSLRGSRKGSRLSLRYPSRHHLSCVIPLQVRPGHIWVVSENGQPLLRQCLCVIALAALDRLQRKEIKPHNPSEVEVRRGGNQVRDVTRSFATVFDNYGLHVRGVPRENLREYPWNDLLISMQQVHLAALDQRIVVLADVADGVALVLTTSVLPFALLHAI